VGQEITLMETMQKWPPRTLAMDPLSLPSGRIIEQATIA